MPRSLAHRLAARFANDSPTLPLVIICLLCGLILFVAGERGLTASQPASVSTDLPWGP